MSRSRIASVCLKQWKVICLPIPAAEMSWGTLWLRTYGDRVGKMAPLFLIVPLFAISFLNALLDTNSHCFNKNEEYHVINKYLPKRSVTECPDFEETVDTCCNKCEQHNGQIQPSPYIGVGVSWNFLQFQVLLMKIIRP